MRGERGLLRVGDLLVDLAARRLPAAARDERRREWAAELPVILSDPEVKPAAARAVRMLWFAADTLRGSALRPGPGPARHRGAHRGQSTWGASARWLGMGMLLLAAALALLAAAVATEASVAYVLIIYDVSLVGYVSFLLTSLAMLAVRLLRRRSDMAFWYWSSAGVVVEITGPHISALAGHLGWGHPLPFTATSICGYAVAAACFSVSWVIGLRSDPQDRRSSSSS